MNTKPVREQCHAEIDKRTGHLGDVKDRVGSLRTANGS